MSDLKRDFTVMVLNAENLFLLSDAPLPAEALHLDESSWQKLSTSVYDNKPLRKLTALARSVTQENPDIVILNEVGGLESLENFNRLFLSNHYSCLLLEGNSDRNIDVGYLVKRSPDFYLDINTNKNRPLNFLYPHEREIPGKASHKFSRDVSELTFFKQDRDRPFLILLAAHLKSRLDPDGIDPTGFERRQAELKTLIEIYLELETKHNFQVPIGIGGDFNGRAARPQTDPEFEDIYAKTQLVDVCEIANIPTEKRATYFQVNRNSFEGKQLDYFFCSPGPGPTR